MKGQVKSASVTKSSIVTLAGQASKLIIQLLSVIILSRLLNPSQFGEYAVLAAIVALGELIRDFGILNTAIGRKSLSPADLNKIFKFSLTISAVVALLVILLAFIFDGSLSKYLYALSFIFILNGAQTTHQVILIRRSNFSALALSEVVAQLLGLFAAIILAVYGFGTWTLVLQSMVIATSLMIVRSVLSGWRPKKVSSSSENLSLYADGARVGFSQLLTYAANNAATYGISWFQGENSVGLYSRAFQIYSLPISQLLAPLNNVIIPSLSRSYSADDSFNKKFLLALSAVLFPTSIILTLFFVFSKELIEVLLGVGWGASATILQALSLGGVFQVLSISCFWIFLATGMSRQLLLYSLLSKPLTVIMILVGASHSHVFAAFGYSIALSISLPYCFHLIGKRIKNLRTRVYVIASVLFCQALLSSILAKLIVTTLIESIILVTVLSVILSTVFYLLLIILIPFTRTLLLSLLAKVRVSRTGV